ncbi:MAG: hypothetical protein WKF47_15145 [Geodermatophilaceae bacterium]
MPTRARVERPPARGTAAACGDDVARRDRRFGAAAVAGRGQADAADDRHERRHRRRALATWARRQQEWRLFDGQTRLWGSNDCQFERRTPTSGPCSPGEQVTLQVQWTGTSSDPAARSPATA